MRKPLVFAVLAAALFSLSAFAQGPIFSSSQLVGWTDPLTSPSTTPGLIEIQDPVACPNAKVVCKNVLDRSVVDSDPTGGGTAYDPREQAVWVSEGLQLVAYELRGCKVLCRHKAALINSTAHVSGLAHSDRNPRLFHLETTPGYFGIVTYDHRVACQPRVLSQCRFPLPGKSTAAGLAYDERKDVLYIAVYDPATRKNLIYVAPAKDPCNPVCKWELSDQCVGTARSNQVFGLAFDACRKELYATHGAVTSVIFVSDPMCKFLLRRCCTKGTPGYYRGLAVVPGWKTQNVGKPCMGKPCASCPSMSSGLYGGDPGLGNTAFGLALTQAPAGSIAIPVLGVGNCTKGLPFFCGFLHPAFAPISPLILPAQAVTGSGCSGTAMQPLPLPTGAGLCGQVFCAQWVIFCPSPIGLGVGLSDATEFMITTS